MTSIDNVLGPNRILMQVTLLYKWTVWSTWRVVHAGWLLHIGRLVWVARLKSSLYVAQIGKGREESHLKDTKRVQNCNEQTIAVHLTVGILPSQQRCQHRFADLQCYMKNGPFEGGSRVEDVRTRCKRLLTFTHPSYPCDERCRIYWIWKHWNLEKTPIKNEWWTL